VWLPLGENVSSIIDTASGFSHLGPAGLIVEPVKVEQPPRETLEETGYQVALDRYATVTAGHSSTIYDIFTAQ
jgi:hypothetical protein